MSTTRASGRRTLQVVAGLLIALAALAPAAQADPYGFRPGSVVAKAHPPLHPEPPLIFAQSQGVFIGGAGGQHEDWVEEIVEAEEPTQAGGHPDFTTTFRFASNRLPGNGFGHDPDGGHPREVITDAPPGAIGNPLAVPRCEAADFHLTVLGRCPKESQVGTAITDSTPIIFLSPISSLVPSPGDTAQLGFKAFGITVVLKPQPRSDGDYGLRIPAEAIATPLLDYQGSTISLWGVPHDPVHDPYRVSDLGFLGGHVEGGAPRPFLSAPTNCDTGPLELKLKTRSWEDPGHWVEETDIAPEGTGCEEIGFDPTLSARPSSDVADSPSGFEVDLRTPQNENCEKIEEPAEDEPQYECGLATSHLKDTLLTLPEGLTLNPSGANGLDGCSSEEIGLTTPLGTSPQRFTAEPPDCPDASAIGNVEVDTPLLEAPMPGRVYLADPHDNPFESLLSVYIVADDRERDVIVKLAAKVEPDPETGQLTAIVTDAPQLPFSNFRLSFKQGPHAPLRTPATCGTYETGSKLVPYANPQSSESPSDRWKISKGPSGPCPGSDAQRPHTPTFNAGTITPIAGVPSPFVMHLAREDSSQEFGAVTLTLPPGLLAKLAGTPICPTAFLQAAEAKSGKQEQQSPSCPLASRLGGVVAAAGAGPDPYHAPGAVYLAGPYKGAPLSLAIIAPAVAGPFDLGNVVNRVAAYIDPRTAQITAVSDPLPEILEGIPLDIKSVDVSLDRPDFTRNPTNCDPMAAGGLLSSTQGALAPLLNRFQVAECGRLGFKPKVFLRLYGKRFTRGSNPRLRAVIVPRAGDANISRVAVTMPSSLFLDQSHIRTVCTRVQFAADACPPGSVYGKVIAQSPLVDYPLTGNVYLRSSNNKLPDLVADLRGPAYQPVRIEGVGRTDSVKGALRNTFDIVPDAPVSKIVLLMQGGKKSLLVASRDLCKGTQRAKVNLSAHNGRARLTRQKIAIPRCDRKQKRRGAKRKAKRRQSKAALARGSAAE